MTRVLVTGATGRLGRVIVARLRGSGVRPITPGDGVDAFVDLDDDAAIAALVESSSPEVIVHLGAVVPSSPRASAGFATNATSTAALARAAERSGVRRVILASTAGVYGDSREHPLRESDGLDAGSPYALSKVQAEQALLETAVETVALRLFNVYGPGFDDSLVARLQASTASSPATLRTLDDFVRDYVHVSDVATAVEAAVGAELPDRHATINVGTGRGVSNRELLDAASAVREVHAVVVNGPASFSIADTSLARELLGFTAATGVLDALG